MGKLKIKNVTKKNLKDFINLCIPPDKRNNELFIKGIKTKMKWVNKVIKIYKNIAKLAYLNSRPVGMIQYLPDPEERIIRIRCIFVPEKQDLRKGIGKSLFNSLLEDMKKPKSYFGNKPPLALVVHAFNVPGRYPQSEFFEKMGFKRVKEDEPLLLYYPIKKDFFYTPPHKEYKPCEEDKGKALIFFDPSCPFSIYFSEKIKEAIKKIVPHISIRMINEFEESEEVEKRGKVPVCIVNKKPIISFFLDEENFQKEVREAL